MIDIHAESLLTLRQAAESLPNKPDPRTVRNWIDAGVATRRGRVYLESVRIGARIYTSREAIDRFLLALQTPDVTAVAPAHATKPKRVSAWEEDAIAYWRAQGVRIEMPR